MDKNEIAQIVANVMYLDNPQVVESGKSLFLDYGMSSIDFIDFAFEVKSRSGKSLAPDHLWPINKMAADPENYFEGHWTELGQKRLREIFTGVDLPDNPAPRLMSKFFTVDFVAQRVAAA